MSSRLISGRYNVLNLIGKGGMSNVYLAEDMRTGHQVAVKILRAEFSEDEEFLQRFSREAHAASKVSHHNIVNLLDVGMEGDMRYLVMEYVQGTTLKELIKAKGRLPVDIAVQITIRILSALQHTHRNGVIHRDIKPQNILVQSQGHIKVADFGIAKVANSATLSKGDSIMGSVHYFSPEQAAGEEVLQTGDIYSVGVVLYEMLTGKMAFEGDSPVAVAMQHLHNKPRPIQDFAPDVPKAVCDVVTKAMEKKPEDRYQYAIDMASDLKRALENKEYSSKKAVLRNQEEIYRVLAKEERAIRRKKKRGTKVGSSVRELERVRFKKTRRGLRILLALGSLMTVAALALGVINIYKDFIATTHVPDLFGEDATRAYSLLSEAQLIGDVQEINSESIPEGIVISQTPESGERIRKGATVVYQISIGKEMVLVPDVVGISRESAANILNAAGMTLEIADRQMSDEKKDIILTQEPLGDTEARPGQIVQVVLSGGKTIMPDVCGGMISEALESLKDYDQSMIILEGIQATKNHPKGMVIQQKPEAGSETMLRTNIVLTVADERWEPFQGMIFHKLPRFDEDGLVQIILETKEQEYILQWEEEQEKDKELSISGLIYYHEEGEYNYFIRHNDENIIINKINLTSITEENNEKNDVDEENVELSQLDEYDG